MLIVYIRNQMIKSWIQWLTKCLRFNYYRRTDGNFLKYGVKLGSHVTRGAILHIPAIVTSNGFQVGD